MELKERVYQNLVLENLFNKDLSTTVIRLSKVLKVGGKNIITALNSLKTEERINIFKNRITNSCFLKTGTFKAGKGNFGFVSISGEPNELFVGQKGSALSGDVVEVGFVYNEGKKEAFISKIIERKNASVLGQIVKSNDGTLLFVPDDRSIAKYINIAQNQSSREALGKKVCVNLAISHDITEKSNFGTIDKVFGVAGDPIVENEAIAYQYGFTKQFSEKIQEEVASVPMSVTETDFLGRLDLREKNFFTIDPETCKDMDDAVCIEKRGDNYVIYVAIADVSHYVKEGSEIDKEAYQRGTSCYLGDGVYPMLPEELSNEICSLNEKVDRCTLTAIMEIDTSGKLINSTIKKAVIHSKHKLSYEVAQQINENIDGKQFEYADIKKDIDMMYEASEILTKMRKQRGCLTFDNHEPTFKLDDTKTQVVEVVDKTDVTSKKIIESFMVLANEAVGEFFTKNKIPTLYRVHDVPIESKIQKLSERLGSVGIEFDGDSSPYALQRLLKRVEKSPFKDYATSVILRSLAKAKYQPKNIGHYGLGSEEYIHFTSPIRRYPDLIAHRMISKYIESRQRYLTEEQLVPIGEHLTSQERLAEDAEKQSDKLLCAMWAENHINEVFEGFIYSIENSAIVVRVGLVNILVPSIELLDSKYGFKVNNNKTSLINIRTDNTYSIGQKLSVKISGADRMTKTIFATTDLSKQYTSKQQTDREETKNQTF